MATEWLLHVSITPEVLAGRRGTGKKQSSRITTFFIRKTTAFQKSYRACFYLISWARTRSEVTHSQLQERLEHQLLSLGLLLPRQNFCKAENSESSQAGSLSADKEGEG